MPQGLLEGTRVVVLGAEAAARAGRVLADLGAEVVRVIAPGADPLAARPAARLAWSAGTTILEADPTGREARNAIAAAHVVIDAPRTGDSPTVAPDGERAWITVTPFGATGPRAHWRASDLGIMAASGNMFCTGDPDRAPLRAHESAAYAHSAGEAAFAALSALATGRAEEADLSMQECVFVANMVAVGNFFRTAQRGARRGASIGKTREIWPTLDGFVSFGIRGGKARQPSMELISRLVREDGIEAPDLEQDWATWSQNTAPDEQLAGMERAIGAYFARRTMQELYDIACETNLMLAPANSPREVYQSAQLEARGFFGPVGEIDRFPRSFVVVRSADGEAASAVAHAPAVMTTRNPWSSEPARSGEPASATENTEPASATRPAASEGARRVRSEPARSGEPASATKNTAPASATRPAASEGAQRVRSEPARSSELASATRPAWQGLRILEFGSGAAGPIATRYFVEHGATVLRVESRTRPDFLRAMAIGPDNPHGLEGAPMYDGLNVGKRNVTFNLKHPRAVALVRRLVAEWADAVAENYAPRAMKGFGLDYDTLCAERPDLVMVSACLNGQFGPHKDYPGFGGQGSALSGWNWVTGWPDREPVGPHGTITDSLAPRYVATALAAGLHYRARTGRGVHLDISQVETGLYALAPWLLEYHLDGDLGIRRGNRSTTAAPHGVFPCRAEDALGDRWVAIACHDDAEWSRLAAAAGFTTPGLEHADERLRRVDEVEALVAAWTSSRSRDEVTDSLQALGIEAVPVQDFADLHRDPQVAHREHFVTLTHPFMGEGHYDRNGIRFAAAASGYDRAGPTLGQDNDWVLGDLLGLDAATITDLAADGALS